MEVLCLVCVWILSKKKFQAKEFPIGFRAEREKALPIGREESGRLAFGLCKEREKTVVWKILVPGGRDRLAGSNFSDVGVDWPTQIHSLASGSYRWRSGVGSEFRGSLEGSDSLDPVVPSFFVDSSDRSQGRHDHDWFLCARDRIFFISVTFRWMAHLTNLQTQILHDSPSE